MQFFFSFHFLWLASLPHTNFSSSPLPSPFSLPLPRTSAQRFFFTHSLIISIPSSPPLSPLSTLLLPLQRMRSISRVSRSSHLLVCFPSNSPPTSFSYPSFFLFPPLLTVHFFFFLFATAITFCVFTKLPDISYSYLPYQPPPSSSSSSSSNNNNNNNIILIILLHSFFSRSTFSTSSSLSLSLSLSLSPLKMTS